MDLVTEGYVAATDRQRRAWSEAERPVHELTARMAALQAATDLAGTPANLQEQTLALAVDATGLHRHRVWED